MVEDIHPFGPSNLLNNMVKIFANTGNTLPPGNLRTFGVRHESTAFCRWGVFHPEKKIETTTHGRGARGAHTSSLTPCLTPTQGGHATKPRLRVPNPNSRGHATKRGFKDSPPPLVHPLKGHHWGTGPKACRGRARRPPGTLTFPHEVLGKAKIRCKISHPLNTHGSVESLETVHNYLLLGKRGIGCGKSPKEGGNATSPLHSRGSPTKARKSENKT